MIINNNNSSSKSRYRGLKTMDLSNGPKTLSLPNGFTIVELVVVIVIIGILATISAISYRAIINKAAEAALRADLEQASSQLSLYKSNNGEYPENTDTANKGEALSRSEGTSYQYTLSYGVYCLSATSTKTNGVAFHISSSNGSVEDGACNSLAVSDPANWLVIGTQVWAKYNLNVGDRIAGTTSQTNNGGTNIVEKYCYGDTDEGCTSADSNGIAYGGLYQWDEAMQYVATPTPPAVAQGICPTGSHIPTDNDWKILEMQLGMSQAQADATGWRDTDEGTKLKSGGSSGLNIPLAGDRFADGSFDDLFFGTNLWSSSESGTSAWRRYLYSGYTTVFRDTHVKGYGFSVRCLGN